MKTFNIETILITKKENNEVLPKEIKIIYAKPPYYTVETPTGEVLTYNQNFLEEHFKIKPESMSDELLKRVLSCIVQTQNCARSLGTVNPHLIQIATNLSEMQHILQGKPALSPVLPALPVVEPEKMTESPLLFTCLGCNQKYQTYTDAQNCNCDIDGDDGDDDMGGWMIDDSDDEEDY